MSHPLPDGFESPLSIGGVQVKDGDYVLTASADKSIFPGCCRVSCPQAEPSPRHPIWDHALDLLLIQIEWQLLI
ncbi:MAG TPA: hypothetical protein VJZ27_07295 [Aggregatilineales bacterium]|nr:hypothetical protein [Aggregatilineales bacterium]